MSKPDNTKLLLVDDDLGHAELVKLNLARSGIRHEILHFMNGHDVVEFLLGKGVAHSGSKYLVLLDINMPGFDGHQVLERLKQDRRTRNIPVIILTTAEDEREIDRCYALGCNFYLTKPMEYDALCEAIRDLGLFIQKARFPAAPLMAA
jgi:CheY-like chemotaxis protein